MKKSIRIKLFILFIGLMSAVILCGVLINTLFLKQYYVFSNKKLFENEYSKVLTNINLNSDELTAFIEEIDRNDGIGVTISDKTLEIKLSSNAGKKTQNDAKVPKEVENLIISRTDELEHGYIYAVTDNTNSQTSRLVYIAKQKNGDLIILSKPMKGIKESTDISNRFFILAGLLVLFFGSAILLLFSKKVTKPIVEMNSVARSISNLNFDDKVEVESSDEIGELGTSINTISDKLKVSIDGLKQDIEHQKELARNTSHELKTPIGVIKGYAEGLIHGVAQDNNTRNEYLNIIVNECDRMDKMVKELLDLSVLQAKNATLGKVTQFTAASLIGTVLERFAPVFNEQDIKCQIECPQNFMLQGDYELLERALGNILLNAVKYNNDNRYIKICVFENDEKKVISVYNTGTHIPENDLENIFEVFFKVDKARSRELGGHGLGLAIVKSIINLHNGEVFAENKQDGVEFTVILK